MQSDLPPKDEAALMELSASIAEIPKAEVVRKLLDELFTPGERRDLALRWRLLRLLAHGVPQRRIAADLGVSLCKITRGSGVLKEPGSVCRSILSPGLRTQTLNAQRSTLNTQLSTHNAHVKS